MSAHKGKDDVPELLPKMVFILFFGALLSMIGIVLNFFAGAQFGMVCAISFILCVGGGFFLVFAYAGKERVAAYLNGPSVGKTDDVNEKKDAERVLTETQAQLYSEGKVNGEIAAILNEAQVQLEKGEYLVAKRLVEEARKRAK